MKQFISMLFLSQVSFVITNQKITILYEESTFSLSMFRDKIPVVFWHGDGNYVPQTTYLSHPYETGSVKTSCFFMKPALLDRKVLETERLKSVNCENECDFSIVRCIGKRLIYNRQQERIFAASVSVSLSCRLRSQN